MAIYYYIIDYYRINEIYLFNELIFFLYNNVEPAIKYIESAIMMNTPDLSATLINFLRHLVDQYCQSLSQVMLKHVKLSMHTILSKNVIRLFIVNFVY